MPSVCVTWPTQKLSSGEGGKCGEPPAGCTGQCRCGPGPGRQHQSFSPLAAAGQPESGVLMHQQRPLRAHLGSAATPRADLHCS